jgi:putative Mg2+ transporter-C (MgtC) family protein
MNSFDLFLHHHLSSAGWTVEVIFRLLLAGLAGAMVGGEREIRGREAGFRTHILICITSALVMIVSIQLTNYPWEESGARVHVSVDLIRIAYAVMTGIGFLGAGAILQAKGSVRGLTTAAAMWSVAAVGLAAGFGLYTLTVIAAVLVVLTLWLFNYVGDALPRRRYRTVKLRGKWTDDCISDAIALFDGTKVGVIETNFERSNAELDMVDIELRLVFTRKREYYVVERRLHRAGEFQLVASQVS